MSRHPGELARDLDTLIRLGTSVGMTDAQLLERFVLREGDASEHAFSALVQRHGPMVWQVCREALGHASDAEDAFQATFLVLVRRAGSIRKRESLASWLYGVALRVASCAALADSRRRARERRAVESMPRSSEEELDADSKTALREEVGRLPEKYRIPVVLCYLEGLTHERAAEQLGCPVGTVRSRLAGARERLRTRLARRGLASSAGVLVAGLGSEAASVPEPLALAAIRAASGASAQGISAAVANLTGVVSKEMFMSTIKSTMMGFLAVVSLSGVVAVATQGLKADDGKEAPPRTPDIPAAAPAKPEIPVLPGPEPIKPGDILLIEVLDALPGRPISGERLVRPDGTISLGFYGDLKVAGLTRDQIKVALIKLLQGFLDEDALGLVHREDDGKAIKVDPVNSATVFVDDSPGLLRKAQTGDAVDRKLDRILDALGERSEGTARPYSPRAEDRDRRLIDHERRLKRLEQTLEKVLQALEKEDHQETR